MPGPEPHGNLGEPGSERCVMVAFYGNMVIMVVTVGMFLATVNLGRAQDRHE